MSLIAENFASVLIETSPPIQLRVLQQSLSIDNEAVPYASAEVICALQGAALYDLDPRTADVWVTITTTTAQGRAERISELTRRYAGKPLSAVTADHLGQSVGEVTRSLYHDYDTPGASRRAYTRKFRLLLRGLRIDLKASTVTLSLASGEARLMDDARIALTPAAISGTTLTDKVKVILGRSGFTLYREPALPVPSGAAIGDEALWAPSVTAWDAVQALIRHHDYILWCDELGRWNFAEGRKLIGWRQFPTSGEFRNVTAATYERSRDTGWFTAVMLVYTWNGVTNYDVATTPGAPIRLHTERLDKPFPGTGRARSKLEQLINRGASLNLTAVADYGVVPGENALFMTPRGQEFGLITGVTWSFPDDTMALRIRKES